MHWQLTGSIATLNHRELSVQIAMEYPQRGIQVDSAWGHSLPQLKPLCFTALPVPPDGTEQVDEVYVRGDDLIVRYHELPTRDVRPSAEWHDLQPELSAAAIELRLFTQTRWLESHPEIQLSTEFPHSADLWSLERDQWHRVSVDRKEVPAGDTGAFLVRLADSEVTYAEFIYPSDFHGAECLAYHDSRQLRYRFFSGPLEKGVVRVGRVWAAWLSRNDDEREATRLYHRLCESHLPLTA